MHKTFGIYANFLIKSTYHYIRIQNMRVIDGRPEFSGVADVVRRVLANEGFFALWKGFLPYYFRLGPHTVLTFIYLEQLNALYKRLIFGKSETINQRSL